MKAIHSIIAAAAFSFVQPAPASAAQGDPEVIIYRFPGVRDNGAPSAVGMATIFVCTNFSGTTENVRIVVRNSVNTIVANATIGISHLSTIVAATHPALLYATSLNLQTSGFTGTAAIAATSTDIICTAMVIDAAATVPQGIALRGIRFAPVPGSQE
jgi:hypothetical protein